MPPIGSHQLNIVDYGAVCDGVANDSAAIQAANDDAENIARQTGARVSIVYPEYSTCLVSGVIIKADQIGKGTTLKVPDNADSWMFNIGAEDILISGFIFDGNRDNNPAASYDANFIGNCKNSIIQAYGLCARVTISNNTFKNTTHSAIALVDQTPNCFYQPSANHPSFQGQPITMQDIDIDGNTFRNIGTMALWAENPYSKRRVDGDRAYLNGRIRFRNNEIYKCGTITPPLPNGITNHGNATIINGWEQCLILDNVIHDVARIAIKTGGNNNLEVARNRMSECHWAGIEMMCFPLDAAATILPGLVDIHDNQYFSRQAPSQFLVMMGSSQSLPGYTVYPEVVIKNNSISYADNPNRTDAIVVTDRHKVIDLKIENNSFIGPGRGCVSFAHTGVDGFQTQSIKVSNNYMYEGNNSALFYVQGIAAGGMHPKRVTLSGNLCVKGLQLVDLKARVADILIMKNNVFRESRGPWNIYSADNSQLERLELISNEFDQLVHGFSADKLIVEDNIHPPSWPY